MLTVKLICCFGYIEQHLEGGYLGSQGLNFQTNNYPDFSCLNPLTVCVLQMTYTASYSSTRNFLF